MANNIGVKIQLDGEREFRKGVTNCNNDLKGLRAEMELVKASSEGQEDSLESLTRKHEVLGKTLDANRAKEDAVRKGLEASRQNYERIGQALSDLRQQYQNAAKEMDEMRQSGHATDEELEKQKRTVDGLASTIQKAEKNYQTASERVRRWETDLTKAQTETVKTTNALQKNEQAMEQFGNQAREASNDVEHLAAQMKKTEESAMDLGDGIRIGLGSSLVDAAKEGISAFARSTLEVESAQKQLQAATGATTEEMHGYEETMESLYKGNYGDSIMDIADAMAMVKQYTGEVDPNKLEELTQNAVVLQEVFDMDMNESIRGIDALMDSFGISSEHAFDLMAAGAQNGLNKSDELADNIAEYGPLWAQAGFSAEEMFTILQNGLDSGAYNLDRVNDFVKEFGNSLADGRIAQNIDSFSDDTKQLFLAWKDGKVTSKDVFDSVIKDLNNTKNEQEKLTIASTVWSSLGEDNALAVIESLNDVNHAYEDVSGTMEEINEIKYDNLQNRLETLGRTIQMELVQPIMEEALPLMEDGVDFLTEHLEDLIPIVGGVGTAFLTWKAGKKAMDLLSSATEGATLAQKLFNLACNANPVLLLISALGGAATAFAIYQDSAAQIPDEMQRVIDSNDRVVESANAVMESTSNMMREYEDGIADLEAQGKYADILAGKIETLAGKTNLSGEEISVLNGYIYELNQLVPELNLSYDETAKNLSMTNEELEKQIDLSTEALEQKAQEEYLKDLLQQQIELKTEELKLENEKATLSKSNDELRQQEIENLGVLDGWLSAVVHGKYDEYKAYQETNEGILKNNTALQDNKEQQALVGDQIQLLQEQLYGGKSALDENTGSLQQGTGAAGEYSAAQETMKNTVSDAAIKIAEDYTTMKDTVTGSISQQMDMFSQFGGSILKEQDDLDDMTEKVLESFQSQVNGTQFWADQMQILASRGVDDGILLKLAEMGPEGVSYVQAFTNMTDEELAKANELWTKSIDMKDGVNSSVQGMIEQYTLSLNDGKEKVEELMGDIGDGSIQGFVEAIQRNLDKVSESGASIGETVTVSAKDELQQHSPSKVFDEIGQNTVQGLIIGINTMAPAAQSTMISLADHMIQIAETGLSNANFADVGLSIGEGLLDAVERKTPELLNQMESLTEAMRQEASRGLARAYFNSYGIVSMAGLRSGIENGKPGVLSSVRSIVSNVKAEGSRLNASTLYSEGYNVSMGLGNGINAGRSYVIGTVASMCAAAVAEARARLQIHSPSRVFYEIGDYTAEGFGEGYLDRMVDVNKEIAEAFRPPEYNPGKSGFSAFDYEKEAMNIQVPVTVQVGNREFKDYIVKTAETGIGYGQKMRMRAKGGF